MQSDLNPIELLTATLGPTILYSYQLLCCFALVFAVVKTQVESQVRRRPLSQPSAHPMPSVLYSHIARHRPQIKVRDLSRSSVTITPAEFASWADARAELLTEAKRPYKAQLESDIAGAADEGEIRQIRATFDKKEKEIEHEIDREYRHQNTHRLILCCVTLQPTLPCVCVCTDKPLEMHLSLGVSYVSTTPQPLPSHSHRPTHTDRHTHTI